MTNSFRTSVPVPLSSSKISYKSTTMLLGSCFTENIGKRLAEKKLPVELNPFGILYNPSSVSKSIHRLLEKKDYTEEELFYSNERWNSFDHHSRFSKSSAEETLLAINNSYSKGCDAILQAEHLFITFGTAYVYSKSETSTVVSNCHKLPSKQFTRSRLTTDEIVDEWEACLNYLFKTNPKCKVVFTVSPIRHMSDGFHENQLSKATLLLAIEQIMARFDTERTAYFPAFEIMMDDLRDYRFYANDMLHPSEMAIDYIWGKFSESYFDEQTVLHAKQIEKYNSLLQHRPFNQKSDNYHKTITNTLNKMERYQKQYSYLKLDEIRVQLLEKIKL